MATSSFRYVISITCFLLFANASAQSHIQLPPKQIDYICHCEKSSEKGVCGVAAAKNGETQSDPALSIVKNLKGGWKVRLLNCLDHKKYHLTEGAQLFAGKKIKALFDNLGLPMAASGYVYHVRPSMPFTKDNYSITVVSNPAINGIDLNHDHSGWQCGLGNRQVSCHQRFHSARCFVDSMCQFVYAKK